jgi:hypothetical protein
MGKTMKCVTNSKLQIDIYTLDTKLMIPKTCFEIRGSHTRICRNQGPFLKVVLG